MKARFLNKMALSAFILASAGALPSVAQQAASPAAVPAVKAVQMTAAEKALLAGMNKVVKDGQRTGALNMRAVDAVFAQASAAGVSEPVMARLVSMPAGAFPAFAPQIAAAAVKSYSGCASESQVRAIIAAAVEVQAKPYASVAPICEAVQNVLGDCPVAERLPSMAVEIAKAAPDNPFNPVSGRPSSPSDAMPGKDNPGDFAAGGSLVLPGGTPIGGTPTSPEPVSNPSGN